MTYPYNVFDPYWNQVVAYFPCNGIANGSKTIVDTSGNGGTATMFGSAKIDNAFLSGLSGQTSYVDLGTDNTGYIRYAMPNAAIPAGVDFTIEAFVERWTTGTHLATWDTNVVDDGFIWSGSTAISGFNVGVNSNIGLVPTTWMHEALGRVGNRYYAFLGGNWDLINGVGGKLGAADPIAWNDMVQGRLGASASPIHYANARVFGLRITKGVCRYTAPFSPPSGPYVTGGPIPAPKFQNAANFNMPINPFGVS